MVAPGEGRSPMTSSDAEMDFKHIIIIIIIIVKQWQQIELASIRMKIHAVDLKISRST